ncbi:M48 family metalloprotease [Sungkyunkwania multivorans]|uniref:M48 family metalloprotease n=1 Tax=Sungkyunkwania multivorans TaxID=1173618 RepID=A0ABW3D6I8_9FLAO
MKLTITLFISLLLCSSVLAQQMELDTTDHAIRLSIKEKLKARFEIEKKQLEKEFPRRMGKKMISLVDRKEQRLYKYLDKKQLTFDSRFTSFTNKMVEELKNSNAELKNRDLITLISLNPIPNALSLGNDIIIINLGLFTFMDNREEVAAVIAHELAHNVLMHGKKNVIDRVRKDEELSAQQRTKNIKKSKYNTYEQAFDELRELMYSNGKKNRLEEKEADSLGYVLAKRSGLRGINFLSSLEKLAAIDSLPEIELEEHIYKKVFDLPNLPFKDEWLKMESFDEYAYGNYKEKLEKDSLKSHPETVERIKHVKMLFPELTNDSIETTTTDDSFLALSRLAYHASIPNLYFLESYGISTYRSLYRLTKYPENDFYKKWLGKNFRAMYEAKKSYRLNRYVQRLNVEKQSPSLQRFLNFIWNLRLEEIETIANHYDPKE